MYRTQPLFLKYLRKLDPKLQRDLVRVFTSSYDEQRGIGFVNTDHHGRVVNSTLIFQTNQLRRIYDRSSRTIQTEQQTVYKEVPFTIEFRTGLLESTSGGSKLQKLLSTLARITEYKIIIEDVHVDFAKLLVNLSNASLVVCQALICG